MWTSRERGGGHWVVFFFIKYESTTVFRNAELSYSVAEDRAIQAVALILTLMFVL
jgi:hypothetical protein